MKTITNVTVEFTPEDVKEISEMAGYAVNYWVDRGESDEGCKIIANKYRKYRDAFCKLYDGDSND